MAAPRGLRTPGRVAGLAPLVLVLIGAIAAAVAAFRILAQHAAHPTPLQPVSPGAGAGVTEGHMQPELLFGAGSLLLFLVLAYGLWRYQTRNRANDEITEQATREMYDRPVDR
jgi:hypothetical protein